MNKKLMRNLVMVFAMVLGLFALTSCAKNTTEYAGRYDLITAKGIPGVSASTYEYNYIDLSDKGKYHIANKVNGIVTEQSGTFSVKDGTITFVTKANGAKVTEEYDYDVENKTITMKLSQQGYNIEMVYQLSTQSAE